MTERTALYRFFDAEDVLLYVGITNHVGRRWDDHIRKRPWWNDIERQTVNWFPSRSAAEEAEKLAIQTEDPLYNVTYSPRYSPSAKGTGDQTKPRQVRVPDGMWIAFKSVCDRLGTTRSAVLAAHVNRRIEEYGTEDELRLLAKAEAELAERRARKGGRPPKERP